MKQIVKQARYAWMLVFLLGYSITRANNIQVSNAVLTGQNTTSHYTMVQFDLSWEHSWRVNTGASNWDAAWVFVKYSVNQGYTWQHAYLNPTGNSAGDSATVQVGLVDESATYDATGNPAVGAFIYRSYQGNGTFSLSDVQLRWDYSTNGVTDTTEVMIRCMPWRWFTFPRGPTTWARRYRDRAFLHLPDHHFDL